jgi:hypothetical protein
MRKGFAVFAVALLLFAVPVTFAQKPADQCKVPMLEVFFDQGYMGIQDDSMSKVKDFAGWMKSHPYCKKKIKISANICTSSSNNPDTDYSMMISRAEDLEITLTRFGVSVHQSMEYGEKEPAPFGTEREQRCRSAFATVVVADNDSVKKRK